MTTVYMYIKNNETNDHTLKWRIQNETINLMGVLDYIVCS